MLFWEAYLKEIKNKQINEDVIEKRRYNANITYNYMSYNEIEVRKKLEEA